MSEQLYRLCWRYEGETEIHRGEPVSKDVAQFAADEGNRQWSRMIRHWLEPVPPYEPPAVTHEDDLTTAAGSPCMGGDDDLLGIPPGC